MRRHGELARLWRAFGPDLWRHRRPLLVSYALELVAAGALIVAPWPLKLLIDHVIPGTPLPGPLAAPAAALSAGAVIALLVTGSVLVAALGALATARQKVLDAAVGEQVNLELRDRVLMCLQALPLTERRVHRSGELVLRLVDDVKVFVRLQMKTVPLLFRYASTTVLTLVAMWWIAPVLGLVGLGLVPALIAVASWHGPRLRVASRRRRTHEGHVAGLAQEIVRGLPTVRVLGAEEQARGRFERTNAESLAAGLHEARIEIGAERTLSIAKSVATAVVLGGGAWLVLRGRLSVGTLTVCATYVATLLKPADKFNELASAVSKGLAAADRLLVLLERAPEVRDAAGAIDCGRARGELALRDVWFSYPTDDGRDAPVLQGATLRLEPGQLVVLVGESGAGKSTLLALLLRLLEPGAGDIRLDGRPLADFTVRSLRAQFAVMIQETHLFAGTLREALTPSGVALADERLWEALGRVGLDRFVDRLPAGLDATLGEDGVDLSGGQRRRLALARAFLLDRPILLLDEPLSGVDAANERVIVDALERVREGRTCLVITHGTSLLAHADVVYRLVDGRVVREAAIAARAAGAR